MEETTPFVGQGNDSTCAAVAIFNACLHLGIEPPPLASLVGELRCDGGRAIGVGNIAGQLLAGADGLSRAGPRGSRAVPAGTAEQADVAFSRQL